MLDSNSRGWNGRHSLVNGVGGGEAHFDGWPDASWLQIEAGEGRTEGAEQEVPTNRKKA